LQSQWAALQEMAQDGLETTLIRREDGLLHPPGSLDHPGRFVLHRQHRRGWRWPRGCLPGQDSGGFQTGWADFYRHRYSSILKTAACLTRCPG
jgi:hypothetical protein